MLVFTGQGAQYVGMGRGLYAAEPVFREMIDRCDALLGKLPGGTLRGLLFPEVEDAEASAKLNLTTVTQPALFSLQVALAALWRSWGVRPDVVTGHSVGDRIHALIRGTAVNQDGRSNGLTAPNGVAQQRVIRAALANAGVSPDQVVYVEAHGTGTPLGDPIELGALRAVLGERTTPCAVGSVKTNIGHLEAAAGVASLIKVVLSLQHGEIPGQLHFKRLNPAIELGSLEIADRARPFPEGGVAGVSSFGFGGTNAHAVLSAAPTVTAETSRSATR